MSQPKKWLRALASGAVAATLAFGAVPVSALASSFTDVPDGSWYAQSADWIKSNRIMNGYGDGSTFGPNDKVTRGQTAVVMYHAASTDPEIAPESGKTDIVKGAYYENAANWAVEHKVINGYGGTTLFGPDASLKREEAATIIANAAGVSEATANAADATALNQLKDVDKTDSYALPYVKWATANKIINGDNGSLNPQGTVTRAQIAAMVKNAVDAKILPEPLIRTSAEFIGLDTAEVAAGNTNVWDVWAPRTVYRYDPTSDASAWTAFKTLLDNNSATLSYNAPDSQYGAYLDSVTKDGLTLAYDKDTGRYWMFLINGQYSNVGASGYKPSNGDVLIFAYTAEAKIPAVG